MPQDGFLKLLSLALVSFGLWSMVAKAEYRAFNLQISDAQKKPVRSISSNLDPDQYRDFYLLHPGESITYTETWMCPGRTSDFKPTCKSPSTLAKEKAAAEAAAKAEASP